MTTIVDTKIVYGGRSKLLIVTISDGGRTMEREIEDHGNAACVLPFDGKRKTAMLVRQFRAPVFFAARQTTLLEAIAGVIEEPDPAQTARREALEEAGLRLRDVEHVGDFWASPGVSTEKMALYLAPYGEADRVGPGGGTDQDENTEAVELPLADLAAMADDGRLCDMKTLALVQTLRLRRPELFRP